MVSILCNPGIRARHWEQMSEIVNYDLTPNSGSTLRKVLKQNLTSYNATIHAKTPSLRSHTSGTLLVTSLRVNVLQAY